MARKIYLDSLGVEFDAPVEFFYYDGGFVDNLAQRLADLSVEYTGNFNLPEGDHLAMTRSFIKKYDSDGLLTKKHIHTFYSNKLSIGTAIFARGHEQVKVLVEAEELPLLERKLYDQGFNVKLRNLDPGIICDIGGIYSSLAAFPLYLDELYKDLTNKESVKDAMNFLESHRNGYFSTFWDFRRHALSREPPRINSCKRPLRVVKDFAVTSHKI